MAEHSQGLKTLGSHEDRWIQIQHLEVSVSLAPLFEGSCRYKRLRGGTDKA